MADTTNIVSANSQWPIAARFGWITGGVVAVNEPGQPHVGIKAGINGPEVCKFGIPHYESFFPLIQQMGAQLLGATFLVNPSELQGFRHPEFRALDTNKGWLAFDTKQKWRQIAVAAGRGSQMELMDLASRIAAGLTFAESRLGDLARAYSFQLGTRVREHGMKEYVAFKDSNSLEVYKAIHALFWELAVLRDTLAQFAGHFCFSRPEVRSMSGLRKKIVEWAGRHTIADEILRATEKASSGWIAKFSTYRDCFTHLASLDQVAGPVFAVQDVRNISGSITIPQLYYPLPAGIQELYRKRSSGLPFSSLEEFRRTLSRRPQRVADVDALEYLHYCLSSFSMLSLTLIAHSPVAPKPIRLGPEDLIGKVKITRSDPLDK